MIIKKYKSFLFNLIILAGCSFSFGQVPQPAEHIINLPDSLTDSTKHLEFSSLAHWDNKYVLLIPALKNNKNNKINTCVYAIQDAEIIKSIKDIKYLISRNKIIQIPFEKASFEKYISSLPRYDGIEGTVVAGNDIYFSIECGNEHGNDPDYNCTDQNFCYVVKGRIDNTDPQKPVIYLTGDVPIKKPACAKDNDGFEGLAYMPHFHTSKEPCIIAIFENKTGKDNSHIAYRIKTKSFKISDSFLIKTNRRIPDIFFDQISRSLNVLSTQKSGLCTIIKQINIQKNFLLKDIAIIKNNGCKYNWEGITSFNNGILIINDNYNGSNGNVTISKLSYFKITY